MDLIPNKHLPIETERLFLREMNQTDYPALYQILCDPEVMRAAYERPFTPEEAQAWLERHLKRYETLGFGLWAVVHKETGEMIGQCGLTWQSWRGKDLLEIGYLFQKAHWHKGYAVEAARACRDYAFSVLGADRVYSIIRDTHIASQGVATRIGMRKVDADRKTFRNVEMDFALFCAERAARLSVLKITSPRDLDKMTDWMYNWWGAEENVSRAAVRAYLARGLRAEGLPQTFGLYRDGELVGMYQLARNDLFVRPDLSPWLANVFIPEECRGAGYGRALLASVRENAAKAGLTELFLYTSHTGLYEKFGWEFIEAIDTYLAPNRQRLYRLAVGAETI